MTTFKGKEGVIRLGTQFVGEVRSFELSTTSNEVDTSTMGTDWTGVDSTQLSWKGTAEMFWDPEDVGQLAVVVGNKVDVSFYPNGSSAGKRLESGSALVTSMSRPQSHDNIISMTIEFTGDGPLTIGVVV